MTDSPVSGAHRAVQASVSIWRDGSHPIWKLAQQALMLGGALLFIAHGGAEALGGTGRDTSEAVFGAWILRELIGWKRT